MNFDGSGREIQKIRNLFVSLPVADMICHLDLHCCETLIGEGAFGLQKGT